MKDSKIEWCHDTANAWIGCTEVHEGCDHCYARTLNHRWGNENWGTDVPRRAVKKFWSDLDSSQKLAVKSGENRRVFIGSMMDIFEKPMPVVDSNGDQIYTHGGAMTTEMLRYDLFMAIEDGKYSKLIFLFLTKRPSNINKYIPESWVKNGAPENVIFGYSVVSQETARNIKDLQAVNGRRFLSMEPLLGPVDITPYLSDIDWVIVGGESGHGARPMHPDWVRSLRDQCRAFNVPFLFKQWGEWYPTEKRSAMESNEIVIVASGKEKIMTVDPTAVVMKKVGKKEAGNFLDGEQYLEFPA